MTTPLAHTPLHAWHVSQGARMAEFAGFDMPIQYSSIVAEHEATRKAASLFDISHMGRLRFDGPRADEFLDALMTRRIKDMVPGQVRYSLVCNDEGGILDDVLVYCLESPSGTLYFLVVVNASNRAKIVSWVTSKIGDYPEVRMEDTTERTAMIAVQGPKAIEICRGLLPESVCSLGYYRAKVTEQMSKAVIASRTGYTGEDGLELIMRTEDAGRIWENVMMAGRSVGIVAAGLGARDTLRLEAAMPLYGHELSETLDPITAGLDFAVQMKDRHFIGKGVLEGVKAKGIEQKRVGLLLEGRRAARQGAAVLDVEGRQVGEVTSGSFSPTLGQPIAMAYVVSQVAIDGTTLEIDLRGSRVAAKITPLPFYKRAT